MTDDITPETLADDVADTATDVDVVDASFDLPDTAADPVVDDAHDEEVIDDP